MRFTRGRLSLAPFQRVYEEKIFEAAKAASISIFPSNARKYWLSRKDAHERKFQERDAGLSNVLLASPSMIPRGNILPRLVGGGVITVARERSLERLLHVSWAFHRPTILVQVEPRDERRISSSRSPGWPSPFFFTLFVFPPPSSLSLYPSKWRNCLYINLDSHVLPRGLYIDVALPSSPFSPPFAFRRVWSRDTGCRIVRQRFFFFFSFGKAWRVCLKDTRSRYFLTESNKYVFDSPISSTRVLPPSTLPFAFRRVWWRDTGCWIVQRVFFLFPSKAKLAESVRLFKRYSQSIVSLAESYINTYSIRLFHPHCSNIPGRIASRRKTREERGEGGGGGGSYYSRIERLKNNVHAARRRV